MLVRYLTLSLHFSLIDQLSKICLSTWQLARLLPREICIFSNVHQQIIADAKLHRQIIAETKFSQQ